MNIRQPTISDAYGISLVHVRSWQHAYKGIVPQSYLDSMDAKKRTQRWEEGLKNNHPIQLLVIEIDDKIIGFSAYGSSREDDANEQKNAEIYAIYLNPDYIGQGFGRALMASTLKHLKEQNYQDCIIWVLKDNQSAISFYQSSGFKLIQNQKKMFKIAGVELEEACFKLTL